MLTSPICLCSPVIRAASAPSFRRCASSLLELRVEWSRVLTDAAAAEVGRVNHPNFVADPGELIECLKDMETTPPGWMDRLQWPGGSG